MKRIAAVAVLAVCLAPHAAAARTLPVKITGETRLEGRLDLAEATTVEKGAVLVLEAGSSVTAAPGATLQVLGTLKIAGTARRPVVMRASGSGEWQGISLSQGAQGDIRHLKLSGARVGISLIAARVTLVDTTISGGEKAVHLVKEARADITGCDLADSKVGLVVEMKSTGTVKGCTFRDNEVGVGISSGGLTDLLENRFSGHQVAVSVFQRFPGRIAGNVFEGNQVGVRLEQNGPDTVIEKNIFVHNSEAAVQALSYSSPTVNNNLLSGDRYGVVAYMFSSPRILHNRIEKMEEAVHLDKKGMAVVRDNLIERSTVGLSLDFSSYPEVKGNRFEENETHVRLGRFQSAHWEATAGSRKIVMKTAARANSRNPRLADAPEEFPEAVDITGNWWDEKTRTEMADKGPDADIDTIYDGHDLPEVTYEGFGEEKYRIDKVLYQPILASEPAAGLVGWQGREDEQ